MNPLQAVRSNKADCLELAQQSYEYVYAIAVTYDAGAEHPIDDPFHENVQILHE